MASSYVRVAERWPDGSIRTVKLEFKKFSEGDGVQYTKRIGKRARPFTEFGQIAGFTEEGSVILAVIWLRAKEHQIEFLAIDMLTLNPSVSMPKEFGFNEKPKSMLNPFQFDAETRAILQRFKDDYEQKTRGESSGSSAA